MHTILHIDIDIYIFIFFYSIFISISSVIWFYMRHARLALLVMANLKQTEQAMQSVLFKGNPSCQKI